MKKEFIAQLDLLHELGINAVVVQVRPSADAMYESAFEPWSEFLTGTQGKAPRRNWDPLSFMIEESHERCMEFHAWFNPYRGVRFVETAVVAKEHIYFQHPDWFVQYGDHGYFDPGVPAARKFVERVIADVVTRYDIDGVHFDDYYYPYRIAGEVFPDSASFAKYGGTYPLDQKDDWRRENINMLVRELHDTINALKPWVHFGISPFGVWRNKSNDPRGSDTNTSQTNYDDLFGDAVKWMEEGWLDYIVPQCYQYLGRDIMDYRVVPHWWGQHSAGVNYYIGQGPFRLGSAERGEAWSEGNEIDRQMQFNTSVHNLQGSVFFRSLTFRDNPLGVNDSLRTKYYKYPALTPASHLDEGRINAELPRNLHCKPRKRSITIKWDLEHPERVMYCILYRNADINSPENILGITNGNTFHLRHSDPGFIWEDIHITTVDDYRVESQAVTVLATR
jgi:uncharacterized lipoprotein YddW (UPF0748 family)